MSNLMAKAVAIAQTDGNIGRGCAADQRSDIKEQCFCENRCPVSLTGRKIAGNSRLKGASWSKFDEFADEFAAIRAAEFAEKLLRESDAQPRQAPGFTVAADFW
jgi:hypothetical protein